MCNFIKSNNAKCRISSGSNLYCHIHAKYITVHNLQNCLLEKDLRLEHAKNEIRNLNKSIQKKASLHQKQINLREDIIVQLKAKQDELMKVITNNTKAIHRMQEDYNKYRMIKSFEKKRQELIDNGIDIYNYNDYKFHQERLLRNKLAHEI